MPTPRIIISSMICCITLFSCDQKKQHDVPTVKDGSTVFRADTVFAEPEVPFQLTDYAEAFANNVTQHFTVTQRSSSVITGKKGLKVTIVPAVLEKQDGGEIDGNINVHIIELTSSEDLFKCNAATVSDGRLLASGGSYYVGMDCNGKQLRIKNGKHLQMQFPKLKEDAMQLFYGNRNSEGGMNWKVTNTVLREEVKDDISFTYNDYAFSNASVPQYIMPKIFSTKPYYSLDATAYYYDKKMTVRDIIDTINKHTKKVFIDTVYPWPVVIGAIPAGAKRDTNYMKQMYGPYMQFLVKTYRSAEEEERRKKEMEKLATATPKPAEEQSKSERLADQLQRYYQQSDITYLGWINCDRFYQEKDPANVPLELPYTFNKGSVHYFIIFRSFNGLLDGSLPYDDQHKVMLYHLPAGQKITLIAFTKTNGQLYQYKEDVVVQKDKPIKLDFKSITPDEMKKIFGTNVHI